MSWRASESACCTWVNVNRLSSVQNAGRHDAASSLATTEPMISTGGSLLITSQIDPEAAKCSGTVIRLRQLDSDHHRLPRTAWSVVVLDRGAPGSYAPVRRHVASPPVSCASVSGTPVFVV